MRLQRKRGKRGESAAHANLEEEQRPRIERRVLSRRRHNQTKQERAEHVDAVQPLAFRGLEVFAEQLEQAAILMQDSMPAAPTS